MKTKKLNPQVVAPVQRKDLGTFAGDDNAVDAQGLFSAILPVVLTDVVPKLNAMGDRVRNTISGWF
ncbi:hypothetical protein [Oxynema aestuarii]|uniref:hypothetical protein n=1 Tax=Oxynema aestuarii TaxID=2874213 RepID=UPI001B30CD6B|nr:hypothetical protein [Oxynema aestuarii]